METTVLPGPKFELVLPERAWVLVRHSSAPPMYKISTDEADNLIALLGTVRAQMLPEVSLIWKRGQTAECFRNPAYVIERDQLAGDLVLHLHDWRFGWLHYVFTRIEATKFVEEFAAITTAPPPAPAGSA